MNQDRPPKPVGIFRHQVLYPMHHTWFVFMSALDLLVTGLVLYRGGAEMNWVADYVILHHGRAGIVIFKFAIVALVLMICEWVGRRRPETGRSLATWAVVLPAAAVGLGFVQLLVAR